MLNPVREGGGIEVIRYRRRLKIFENFLFFFVLSVSCWNMRFGAIRNFRPTNSASSREKLFEKSCSLTLSTLNLQDDFVASFS